MNVERIGVAVCFIRERLGTFSKEEQIGILKQVADDLSLVDREDICPQCGGEYRFRIVCIESSDVMPKGTDLIVKVCDTCKVNIAVGKLSPGRID